MTEILDVYWGAKRAGRLAQEDESRALEFRYSSEWLSDPQAIPLSVRMPLRPEPFDDAACHVFFANLLPEGTPRALIAAKLGVSQGNCFKLLEALGGECAGALSILPEGGRAEESGRYEPLSRVEIDRMIEDMPRTPLLMAHDDLRLSLAGAQQKIPIYFEDGRFFLPHGSFPSSHILKPAIPHYEGVVENEAFCMELARRAGLPAPKSQVIEGKHPFYLVERYDRRRDEAGRLVRVHQEDFCQALGLSFERKYEADGGPGLAKCFALIDEHGTRPAADKMTMLRWVVFNSLIGNCDAHAKNLSMLITPGEYRLSPLYDLLSTRAYGQLSPKFAMRLGGRSRSDSVKKENWMRLAKDAGVGPKAILDVCGEMGEKVPELARALAAEAGGKEVIGKVLKHISTAATRMLATLH